METPMEKKGIEKPDWTPQETIKFEKMPLSDGDVDHWYDLQVRSFDSDDWISLGQFNRSSIFVLFMKCNMLLKEE